MRNLVYGITMWIALMVAGGAAAQQPKELAYDVVSVKPSEPGHRGTSVHVDDNIYTAINISLKQMLQAAYGIRQDLISGGPAWVDSTGFDIHAKIIEGDPRKLDEKGHGAMMQAMLIDRFQLKVHTETRVLPVYELVVMKDGPKFNAASPMDKDKKWNNTSSGGMNIHNGQLVAHDVALTRLIDVLASQLHRGVIDKTGLAGSYDLQLNWTRDDDPSPDATAPYLAKAIEEQLGLKLVATKGPVETLVIDRVELPAED